MARTLKSDKLLFWAPLLLVMASVVMVYSASVKQAADRFDAPYYFMVKQFVWAVLGVGLLLAAMRVDYHQYRRPAVIWSLVGAVTLALVAVFFFHRVNGTRRWLSLGFVSLQPSELAKLAIIFFTAALLERRMHRVNDASYALVPIGLVTSVLAGLVVLEPDFGTSAVIVLVVLGIVFAAGLRYRYLFGMFLLLVPAAAGFIMMAPYRTKRLMTFIDPYRDPLGDGFQTIQSLIAVGSGGVFGRGFMHGVQKLFYIPEPHTDFIFAVIAEELGLIGTSVVLICFAIIAWRGLRASLLAPDRFGALLALGLTMMVTVQALVNMCVVVSLLPAKGIPLPFVSNGGSSLVINLIGVGILLNISQQASPAVAASQ